MSPSSQNPSIALPRRRFRRQPRNEPSPYTPRRARPRRPRRTIHSRSDRDDDIGHFDFSAIQIHALPLVPPSGLSVLVYTSTQSSSEIQLGKSWPALFNSVTGGGAPEVEDV